MIYLCGFLMALADSVPGVSGGTIAFLLGYYDDFIGSLDSFVSVGIEKNERKARIIKALKFLARLGTGWIVGFVSAVLILTSLFQENIYEVSSLFLGFIVFSIPLVIKEEMESIRQITKKWYNVIFLLIGTGIVVLLTVCKPSADSTSDGSFNLLNYLFFTLTGMLGISAMVLPGISGSTILLIFGTYIPVMTAIKNFLHFDFSGILELIFFGTGIIAGILVVIKLIKISLEKFRSQTIYAILGLMLGSLYAVTQGPATLKENPKPPMTFDTFSIIFFIIGGAVICGLQVVRFLMGKRKKTLA